MKAMITPNSMTVKCACIKWDTYKLVIYFVCTEAHSFVKEEEISTLCNAASSKNTFVYDHIKNYVLNFPNMVMTHEVVCLMLQ